MAWATPPSPIGLFITEGGVHKHIRNIFAKLDLTRDDRVDRRVAAVLRYLENS